MDFLMSMLINLPSSKQIKVCRYLNNKYNHTKVICAGHDNEICNTNYKQGQLRRFTFNIKKVHR